MEDKMGNMAYCRFSNTVNDLRECYDHIDDDDLSEIEEKARKALISICKRIIAATDTGEESDD